MLLLEIRLLLSIETEMECSLLRCVYIYLKIIYLLAALGLRCCMCFSLVTVSGGHSLGVVCRLLVAVASLVAEHGL